MTQIDQINRDVAVLRKRRAIFNRSSRGYDDWETSIEKMMGTGLDRSEAAEALHNENGRFG